jgi:hypothetical protein
MQGTALAEQVEYVVTAYVLQEQRLMSSEQPSSKRRRKTAEGPQAPLSFMAMGSSINTADPPSHVFLNPPQQQQQALPSSFPSWLPDDETSSAGVATNPPFSQPQQNQMHMFVPPPLQQSLPLQQQQQALPPSFPSWLKEWM